MQTPQHLHRLARATFAIASPLTVALLFAPGSARLPNRAQAPVRIEVIASKFAFTPNEITIKEAEPVELVLKSTDVAHGLRIRDLGVDIRAGKGQSGEASFTPDKTGDFVGRCSVFCGSGHGAMKLTVHVVKQ